MPLITRDYHRQIISTMKDLSRHNKWWSSPINLGGSGGTDGGSGIPIGGMHGQLIQSKVAYDTTEAGYTGIVSNPPSGSLVDNLAHIRYSGALMDSRITNLETISGLSLLEVQEDDVTTVSEVTVLNFEGGLTTVDEGAGKVTVIVSGIGPGGSGIDHGTLSGLLDPDHLQYLLHKDQIEIHDSGGITITSGAHVDPGADFVVTAHHFTFDGGLDVNGPVNIDGTFEHTGGGGALPAEFLDGIQTEFRDNNVTDPPTDAELNTAFGTTHREGFIGILDDAGNNTDVWLVVSTDGSYHYIKLTLAT